ncbi:MAG: ImmA/IrrE family metallo-endopeptidase [Pseudomonadota bacterium]
MLLEESVLAEALLQRSEALSMGPPTSLEAVIDYLADEGLQLRYYDPLQAPEDIRNTASQIDEALVRNGSHRVLFINRDRPRSRIRFSLWHGIGHFCLPSHDHLNYVSRGCTMSPGSHRPYERQADRFAAAMNMPPSSFQPDMFDLPFGMPSIERLAERYIASVESAAIHYVNLSNSPCALISLRPDYTDQGFGKPASPLGIRYYVKSQRFSFPLRSGTRIPFEDPLFWICSEKGLPVNGEISGRLLGLKEDVILEAECRPQGRNGNVLALVSLPRQAYWW